MLNQQYGTALGLLYAEAIVLGRLSDPPLARHAIEQLNATSNVFMLEASIRMLQSAFNQSLMTGRENREAGELAQKYFRRAEALDPTLDRSWVLPQIPKEMIGMLAPGAKPRPGATLDFEAAERKIQRLSLDAFPQLPPAVADVLRRRGCTVPQPDSASKPENVIRGEFFAAGEAGWAALCSVNGISSILVFRNDSDRNPAPLAAVADKAFLQGMGGDRIAFSRGLGTAGRDYIERHRRAYGGPKPPPLDHLGIEDSFLGKASVIHYYYQGKWLELTGAD